MTPITNLNEYQNEAAKTDIYGEVFTKAQVQRLLGFMIVELPELHNVDTWRVSNALDKAIEFVGSAPLVNASQGISGEAGEVSELVKKMIRDEDGDLSEERREKLVKELGDLLWYLSKAAREAGVTMEEVATTNIEKLRSRQERGTLRGSGDDR